MPNNTDQPNLIPGATPTPVAYAVVKTKAPGRPRRMALQHAIADKLKARADWVAEDPIVKMLTSALSCPPTVEEMILLEMAKTVATLEYERADAEAKDMDASDIVTKRMKALQTLNAERAKAAHRSDIDFKSEGVQVAFTVWLENMVKVLDNPELGISKEMQSKILSEFDHAMDGWEVVAEGRLREE